MQQVCTTAETVRELEGRSGLTSSQQTSIDVKWDLSDSFWNAILAYKTLTWLQPPASERWFGYFQKDKKAEVWMEPACVSTWKWSVLAHGIQGEVAGIGEPEVDRFNAQMIAAAMYVQAESEQLNSI